ncbi:hypothetical protein BH09BAC4_BH09BAC4_05010 [soil metagenome]
MDTTFDSILAACPLLGIDSEQKTRIELEALVWKAMYERLAAHVEQMQAAYERVLLGECNTMAEHGQFEQDVAFLTDHFLSRRPFDLLEFLRRSQQPQGVRLMPA